MSVEFETTVLQKLDAMDQKVDDVMTLCRQLELDDREIIKKVDAIDKRVRNVESVVKERWDIPNLKMRLETIETVVCANKS